MFLKKLLRKIIVLAIIAGLGFGCWKLYQNKKAVVKEKDEMPVITDWDDALSMTEADVDRVYEDIGAFVGTFQEKLAETIGFLAYLLF